MSESTPVAKAPNYAPHQEFQSVPILNLRAQHERIGSAIESRVLEVLRSGNYILSENVTAVEEQVAALCGTSFGIGVGNGTDALILALWALDIGPGDEVITTSFTFAATVEAIVLRGAKPVFVDIDEKTFNINPDLIEAAITPATRAILPVHLYGLPADMARIKNIADKHGLAVIEDNAQAIGASVAGKPTGSFGDLSCISFYPTKNLGACGDAGMIVTGDEKLSRRLRSLRAHGMNRRYFHDELGINSRLDELQATVLVEKLKYIHDWNLRRAEIAETYSRMLEHAPQITTPLTTHAGTTHVWHQYTIRVQSESPGTSSVGTGTENETRKWLSEKLQERGIGTMCYYPIPLHMQVAFEHLGYKQGDFPITELVASQVLSLPMYPELTDAQVEYVATGINDLMSQRSPAAAYSQTVVYPA